LSIKHTPLWYLLYPRQRQSIIIVIIIIVIVIIIDGSMSG